MKAAAVFQLKLLKCSVDEENLAMKQNSAYYSTNARKSAHFMAIMCSITVANSKHGSNTNKPKHLNFCFFKHSRCRGFPFTSPQSAEFNVVG